MMFLATDEDVRIAETFNTARVTPGRPFKLCLVLDATSRSDVAIAVAARMTWPASARAHILAIVPGPLPLLGLSPEGQRTVSAALAGIREERCGVASRVAGHVAAGLELQGMRTDIEVREGHPSSIVLAWTRANRPDLIVIGARAFSLSKEPYLSPTAHRVYHQASCSVLLARDPECAQPSMVPRADVASVTAEQAAQASGHQVLSLLPYQIGSAVAGRVSTFRSGAGSDNRSAAPNPQTVHQVWMCVESPTRNARNPERDPRAAHPVSMDGINLVAVDGRHVRSSNSVGWKGLVPRIAKYASCSVLVLR